MDGFIVRFEHCTNACMQMRTANRALNNAYPDPPIPADREVPIHGWCSLCVEGLLWMGS